MKRLAALALALAALSSPTAAEAQSLPYMTVDAVIVSFGMIKVTGVVQGEVAPSTVEFTGLSYGTPDAAKASAALEACHRMLVLALSKPGQYLARVRFDTCEVALVKP